MSEHHPWPTGQHPPAPTHVQVLIVNQPPPGPARVHAARPLTAWLLLLVVAPSTATALVVALVVPGLIPVLVCAAVTLGLWAAAVVAARLVDDGESERAEARFYADHPPRRPAQRGPKARSGAEPPQRRGETVTPFPYTIDHIAPPRRGGNGAALGNPRATLRPAPPRWEGGR